MMWNVCHSHVFEAGREQLRESHKFTHSAHYSTVAVCTAYARMKLRSWIVHNCSSETVAEVTKNQQKKAKKKLDQARLRQNLKRGRGLKLGTALSPV